MNKHPLPWSLLVLGCALLGACQDRREPVKPTVDAVVAALDPGAQAN